MSVSVQNRGFSSPSFKELETKAKELSIINKSNIKNEFKKLAGQKVLVSGVPYLFGIGIMGFFVAGMTNYFTRKRHKNFIQKGC